MNPKIKKSSWNEEEDKTIINGVFTYGKKWSKISKILLPTRSAGQIRERYTNILDPELNKSKFTDDEDLTIINLFNKTR